MFTTALPRRPRPPGARRSGGLRSSVGEASPLPSKHALLVDQEQESPVRDSPKGKERAEFDKGALDSYTSPVRRPNMRRRPLSLLSEGGSSLASPPPPYGMRALDISSPDAKNIPMSSIPPPPECLESGPSSVRTSLMSTDGPIMEDDNEPGNTLTLRGVQRLIRQHELDTMANDLESRLLSLCDSPGATLPAIVDLPGLSPQHQSPQQQAVASPQKYRTLRTVPSDPSLAFAFSRPRGRGNNAVGDARDLRFAAARAEEDAALIAQLEQALAEARDGEDAQRKAAARLRRDVTRMQRQLEHAEDAVAGRDDDEHRRRDTAAVAAERVSEWTRSAAVSHAPSPDSRVGWGAMSFPEFPREDGSQISSDTMSEASEATFMPQPVHEAVHEAAVESRPASMVPAGGRTRPAITASTFASPVRIVAVDPTTPEFRVHAPSSTVSEEECSVCSSPAGASLKRAATAPSVRRRKDANSRPRTHSDDDSVPSLRRTTSGSSGQSVVSGISRESHWTPRSHSSRLNSVRSMVSDFLGFRRSLGSELGSTFHPTPTKLRDEAKCDDEDRYTPAPRSNASSGSTAPFHLRGSLASSAQTSAYDYPGAPRRVGPVVEEWDPPEWATPTPPPRVVPMPPVPELVCADADEEDDYVPPVAVGAPQRAWPQMPGVSSGTTPSPIANGALAPRHDPWDEYSDRPTPSPRVRNLRPLLLCSKHAVHARTSSLALARERSARGMGFSGLAHGGTSFPPSTVVAIRRAPRHSPRHVAHHHGVRFAGSRAGPVTHPGPSTVPARVMHDTFCLLLIILEYIEWLIILLYRFTVDVRAGPTGAESVIGFKRRQHAKRFYI